MMSRKNHPVVLVTLKKYQYLLINIFKPFTDPMIIFSIRYIFETSKDGPNCTILFNNKYHRNVSCMSDIHNSMIQWMSLLTDAAGLKAVSLPTCHETALISAISWIGTPVVSEGSLEKERLRCKMSNGLNRRLIVTKRSKCDPISKDSAANLCEFRSSQNLSQRVLHYA